MGFDKECWHKKILDEEQLACVSKMGRRESISACSDTIQNLYTYQQSTCPLLFLLTVHPPNPTPPIRHSLEAHCHEAALGVTSVAPFTQ